MDLKACDRCFSPLAPGKRAISFQVFTQAGRVRKDGIPSDTGEAKEGKFIVCPDCADIIQRAFSKRPRSCFRKADVEAGTERPKKPKIRITKLSPVAPSESSPDSLPDYPAVIPAKREPVTPIKTPKDYTSPVNGTRALWDSPKSPPVSASR